AHRVQGGDRACARGRRAAPRNGRLRSRTLFRRHAARGTSRLRRRHAQGGRDRARGSAQVRQSQRRGRPRLPRHARGRQGCAGWFCSHSAALRGGHRRAAGQARPAPQAHRTLLRRLSDAQERPARRGEARSRLILLHGHVAFGSWMPPDPFFWYGLAFKAVMTATVVVAVSVAAERNGPLMAALIAALPTAASATYIILALEHPPAFVAASAVGSMAANAAVAVFALSYAALAQRH